MQEVVRFWVARGADGFRLDAIDRLAKDPQMRDDPPSDEPFGLPLLDHERGRDFRHSRNAAWIGEALAAIREAAGDALLIGEVYLPAHKHAPYLEHLDRAFVFELIQSPWEPRALRDAVAAGAAVEGRSGPGATWALSNHDFGRFPTRFGRRNERAAALLLMTLPGTACIYQGDEIGQGIGPGGDPPYDRVGRDVFRHPMQWDATPRGGFSAAQPWLPVVDPAERNVADQREDPGSLLSFWRELIALRKGLGPGFRMLDGEPGRGHVRARRRAGRDQRGRRARGCPARAGRARDVAGRRRARTGRRRTGQARLSALETRVSGTSCPRGEGWERSRSRSGSHSPPYWAPAAGATRAQGGLGPSTGTCSPSPPARSSEAADNCTKQSGGRYKVEIVDLPTNADQQRELVVRRLAAEDDDIDIIGMDVIWTAEFAEAEWIKQIAGSARDRAERGVLPGPARDREVQGPPVDDPVHHATRSCCGTARTS